MEKSLTCLVLLVDLNLARLKLRSYICAFVLITNLISAQTEEFEIVSKRKKTRYELGITAFTVNKTLNRYYYQITTNRVYAVYSPGLYFTVGKPKHQFRITLNYNRYSSENSGGFSPNGKLKTNMMLFSVKQTDLQFSYLALGRLDRFLTPLFSCNLSVGMIDTKTSGAEQYYYYFGYAAGSGTSLYYGSGVNFGLQLNCTKKLNLKIESGIQYNLLRNYGSSNYSYLSNNIRWQIVGVTCGVKL
jgi:hypothetical protein